MNRTSEELVKLTPNVIETLLEGFDEVQNTRHLIVGARLAVTASETDMKDKWGIDEILAAAERKLDAMVEAISAANERDMKDMVARSPKARSAGGAS